MVDVDHHTGCSGPLISDVISLTGPGCPRFRPGWRGRLHDPDGRGRCRRNDDRPAATVRLPGIRMRLLSLHHDRGWLESRQPVSPDSGYPIGLTILPVILSMGLHDLPRPLPVWLMGRPGLWIDLSFRQLPQQCPGSTILPIILNRDLHKLKARIRPGTLPVRLRGRRALL